jgi:acyl-CoA synthetase (AMP-forming)/AMP-acid ligase II
MVEETAMTAQPAPPFSASPAPRDLFAAYSFDTLISGAARLRPQGLALVDRNHSVPFDLLAGQAAALARLLAECGLKPGERLLLIGGAETTLVIAIVAALRGGFEPALAPLDLEPDEFAAYAQAINAAALAGPSHYGMAISPEMYFAVAAATPSIRFVATLGPEEIDGAVDLTTAATLRYAAERSESALERGRPAPAAARLITFDRARKAPVFHEQSTLMAASLDFVARASIGRETPIFSTLPPTTFAGLVAGPLAALLSGATLHLEGPFDARSLVKRIDGLENVHLVVPAAVAKDFLEAGLLDRLASAVLMSRLASTSDFAPPDALNAPCPILDLYAIDESAVIGELRRADTAVPPALAPHYVGFDDGRILTVESAPQPGYPLAYRGAAVTALR